MNTFILSKKFLMFISIFILSACKTGEVTGNNTPVIQASYSFQELSFSNIDLSPGVNTGVIEIKKSNGLIVDVEYTIFVPQHIEGEKVPLVFGLHGRGQSSLHLVSQYLTPALGDLGGIIFGFDAPEDSDWLDSSSVSMVKEIIDMSIENWPIDEDKIVLTGYSMGGTGTWNIMTKYPNIFAAAIPVASTPQPWVEVPSNKVPLYVIHPENDDYFLLSDIEVAVKDLIDRNALIEFRVIPDTAHEEIYASIPYLYETIDWLNTVIWPE
ncbi:MAG: dienelactone hydrolase family protein [Colwelliaceae bacterium]|nr:dienelactone hydrolase family protein [Colwelliaceae bacterium]